jgi:hypothetical protein
MCSRFHVLLHPSWVCIPCATVWWAAEQQLQAGTVHRVRQPAPAAGTLGSSTEPSLPRPYRADTLVSHLPTRP